LRRHAKFTVLLLLTGALLWWFARGVEWSSVGAELAGANLWLIALGVGFVCCTYFVRALRWRALLAPITEASLKELVAATSVGFGAVFLVGRAGEVVRPAYLPLADGRVRPAASFVTIGVERLYDIVAVVLLFAVNMIWFRAPGGDAGEYAQVRRAGFLLLAGAVVGVGGLVLFRRHARAIVGWLDARLARAPSAVGRVGKVLTHLLEQLGRALGVLTNARELAATVGWTALLWGLIALANWCVLRAFGLPFGLAETIFVLGWALVGSLVPTPGGAAGAFHVATARGLAFLGVAAAKATAVSIILHLVVFGPALLIGLAFFVRSDVKLSRLRQSVAEHERGADEAGDDGRAGFSAGKTEAEPGLGVRG
jgi:glycosyltransferase 2 family protein